MGGVESSEKLKEGRMVEAYHIAHKIVAFVEWAMQTIFWQLCPCTLNLFSVPGVTGYPTILVPGGSHRVPEILSSWCHLEPKFGVPSATRNSKLWVPGGTGNAFKML